MKIIKNSLFISFIIFAILILITASSLKNINDLNNNAKWVVHTYEVKKALAKNLSLLIDMETGQRGFSLTGNRDFLEYEDLAKPQIQKNILHLQTLIKDNSGQLLKLDSLKQLIDLKIAFNVKVIEAREQLGLNAAVAIVSSRRGKQIMDGVRKLSGNMLEVEDKLLLDRNNIATDSYFLARIFAVLGGILSILIAIFLMIINNKSLKLKTNLLKSEAKFKQVLESAPDGIVVIDNNRKMQIVNVQTEKLFGYKREEMIGKEVEILMPDRFRNGHPAHERKFIDEQKSRLMGVGKELFGKRKDGSEFAIEISLVPLQSEDKTEGVTVLATIRDVTEIKRIAKEISDYKNTLDEFAIVAITDQKGIIQYVNDNFCKISKYDREELIGQDHRIINSGYHPKDFIRGIWTTIANGKTWKGEIKNKAKDGTIYWVDTTIVPFLDEHGKPNKYVAVRTDITSRKQASHYVRSLIEASLDPLVTISPEGKITDVNEASVKVTGETKEKLIGTDFSDYFTEPEKARQGYKQVFEKGFVSDYPLTIRHVTGKLTDVLYNASVYKDDEGNVLGVFAAARDISELRVIAKEISDYKYTLDEFAIVAITDQKGVINYVNDNFCKISKYNREELIGQDHRIINSGYHSKDFIRVIWTTIANGKIWTGELKNKAKDGTIYWVDTTIVPFLDEDGKPNKYVAVRTDITEQKRITEELKEAKEVAELAMLNAEDAKAFAESALQSKQQFLANMSHEIRTPMNAILGFTKILLKADFSPKQKEYLDAIKTSSDGLLVLINDILDLAKVDSGKMTFEQTPFKMEFSISTMFQVFGLKMQEKNLSFVNDYDNKIPEVLIGDAVRLNQILLNLLSNAIKFTENGKITISVRLLNEDEEHATIEFAIIDTGTGIPENKLEAIFENFQQATSSTSRLYGGTGLGLAICKQLIEKQGGTILVKSKVDEGSTFSFSLSFQKTNGESKKENGAVELDKDVKEIKILVVEDIKLNQLLMRTILEDFKFKYDMADNGKIAIEKLQIETYDIVLMDLQMPEMNGFEATEYIRNIMKVNIPIIALTADVTTVDVEKCKAVGMNDYVSKPLDERILYAKIIELLKKPSLKNS